MNWDKIKDIITVALIPVLGWVMITMRDIGTLQTKCDQQAAQIMALEAEQSRAEQAHSSDRGSERSRSRCKLEALGQQLTRIERMLSAFMRRRNDSSS